MVVLVSSVGWIESVVASCGRRSRCVEPSTMQSRCQRAPTRAMRRRESVAFPVKAGNSGGFAARGPPRGPPARRPSVVCVPRALPKRHAAVSTVFGRRGARRQIPASGAIRAGSCKVRLGNKFLPWQTENECGAGRTGLARSPSARSRRRVHASLDMTRLRAEQPMARPRGLVRRIQVDHDASLRSFQP